MNDFNRGSEWNKWDLHIHTKDTNKNDQFTSATFDEFCINFFKKAVENNIVVIGVTDYFSIENYSKVKNFISKINDFEELNNIKSDILKICLLPNVELRMLPSTDKGRLINIHCIFNPEYVSKLDNDFFGTLEYSSGVRKYKMNYNGFIELGKELGETNETLALKRGLDSFVVSHSDLQKLRDENIEFRNNTIIVVSNSNQDGASAIQKHFDLFDNESGSLDATRQAIYKLSDMIFSSNDNDKNFFLGIKTGINKDSVIKKCGSLKPCIHGSDAHQEDKLFNPDKKRYCWIKANSNFEGLKQIIYEPSRVYIGENKPQEALHKIDSLELKFDNSTKWENEKFCFSDFQETLYFSPYLTCIIGGRGSGKSTLLNLIAEKINKAEKNFFSELNPKEVKSKVSFLPEEIENIEFLAQNKIEEFAKDSKKFTKAIFKRLDKNIGGSLVEKENEITNGLKTFDNQINLLMKRATLHSKLKEKQKELKQFENIVKTLTDKGYLENKENLQLAQKKLLELQNSRSQMKELYEKLISIQNEYKDISGPKNNYDRHYNELYHDISNLIIKFKTKNYSEDKKEIEYLENEKQQYISAIEEYLKNKGMNDENIRDAQHASSNIEYIKDEIYKLKKEMTSVKKVKNAFSHDNLDSQIDDFEKVIVEQLSHINDKFAQIAIKNSDDVKNIKIEYQVDTNVFEAVFDNFLDVLHDYAKIDIRERATFKNYLREISLDDVISYKKHNDFKHTLECTISNKKSQTYQIIIDIFSQKLYFQIYQLIILKNIKDININKLLKVSYDNKSLYNTSFGQRCTAAIVILISLGNNPIIIDEPEAHLDSSLIANYLVDLIKDKKQHRQIIFATHNANFVLNADAELIIKLENNDGDTKANSFAIENLEYRTDLLKLEGGKEAFQKREKKYGISK